MKDNYKLEKYNVVWTRAEMETIRRIATELETTNSEVIRVAVHMLDQNSKKSHEDVSPRCYECDCWGGGDDCNYKDDEK